MTLDRDDRKQSQIWLRLDWLAVVLVACVGASGSLACGTEVVEGDEGIVAPYVGETTVALLKIDIGRVQLPPDENFVGRLPASLRPRIRPLLERIAQRKQQWMRVFDGQPCYVAVGIPTAPPQVPIVLIARLPKSQSADRAKRLVQELCGGSPVVREGTVLVSLDPKTETTELLAQLRPANRREFFEALQAAGRDPIQLAVAVPEYVRRAVDEILPEVPREVGGGPSSIWTEGLKWMACGIDPVSLEVHVVIQSASPAAARSLRDHLPRALTAALQSIGKSGHAVPHDALAPLIADDRFHVEGDRIHWKFDGGDDFAIAVSVIGDVVKSVRGQAERTRHVNRYKKVLLAMHNYYAAYGALPPAAQHRPKEGKPGLSWRVYLLPFLGQRELFDQFHLDEPWDSPHNVKLLPKMPDVFAIRRSNGAAGSQPKTGYTTCVAPVGKGTAMGQDKPVTLREIRDGTSNTVVLVEVEPRAAVPWTAPRDYEFAADKPLARVAKLADGKWLAGMCDGSVQFLKADIPAELVVALFGMSDGKVIDFRELR